MKTKIIPLFFSWGLLLFTGCAHEYKRWDYGTLNLNATAKTAMSRAEFQKEVINKFPGTENAITNVLAKFPTGEMKPVQDWWAKSLEGKNAYRVLSELRIQAVPTTNQELRITNDGPSRLDSSIKPGARTEARLQAAAYDVQSFKNVATQNLAKLEFTYKKEREVITAVRGTKANYVGLALSGGGIRSASFCTGVLQGLHEVGILTNVGVLSTVSGGGYAGSWYMMHREPDSELFAPNSLHLYHLAQFGNYLTSAHYSKNTLELVRNGAAHLGCWPWYFTSQILTCFNVNCPYIKYHYRHGIREAFQYTNTLATDPPRETRSMAQFLPSSGTNKPFWIINMHLALSGDTARNRNRSGDAFELTPLWAGSDSVWYVKVPPVLSSGSDYWMRPDFGVAASGAAVDSRSLKVDTLGSYALLALNLDLGWYVDSWSSGWLKNDPNVVAKNLAFYATTPFFLYPWFPGYHFRTVTSKKNYLTDGGHFDNLGLYALVRRGCRLIIVADGTQDEGASNWSNLTNSSRAAAFDDLRNAELRIKSDLGADIEMEWDDFRETVPAGRDFGDVIGDTVFTGRIRNLPVGLNHEVKIIYIKAAYSQADQLLNSGTFVDAEKAANPSFPHDKTSNQYYSERKVVSYRELGRRTVRAGEAKDNLFTDAKIWVNGLLP